MTHLSAESLAGYLDDDLPHEERQKAELHLASCTECRQELAEVRQLQRARPGRGWWPIWLSALAAAAVLLVVALPRHPQAPSTIRTNPDAEQHLAVVSPVPSDVIAQGPITFIWRSAGQGASYTLTVQEADGRVVWSTAVADTVAVLPDSLALAPGRTWFWFVDALLPDGRLLSTEVQRLGTRP